jgi:hypothetical protein
MIGWRTSRLFGSFVVGKNSGDEAFGLITSDDRDFEKGWSVFDKRFAVLGNVLSPNGCSLTKAEMNKIGLTPIRSDTRFLSYARQGRTRQKRRNGFGSTMTPEPASQNQMHTARSPVGWLRTVHWHAIYIIAGP